MRPLLPLIGLLAMAAGSGGSFSTAQPMPDFTPPPRRPPVQVAPGYTTAPLPNDEAGLPRARATGETSVAPGFFTRRDQYRGEGLSPSSSAQINQDRRAKPGAGINLTMPLN